MKKLLLDGSGEEDSAESHISISNGSKCDNVHIPNREAVARFFFFFSKATMAMLNAPLISPAHNFLNKQKRIKTIFI